MVLFVVLGIAGAIFDFFYGPCTSLASLKPEPPMSPYVGLSPLHDYVIGCFPSLLVRFCGHCVPSCLVSYTFTSLITSIVMRNPLKGPKCTMSEYFHATWKQRWPGRISKAS